MEIIQTGCLPCHSPVSLFSKTSNELKIKWIKHKRPVVIYGKTMTLGRGDGDYPAEVVLDCFFSSAETISYLWTTLKLTWFQTFQRNLPTFKCSLSSMQKGQCDFDNEKHKKQMLCNFSACYLIALQTETNVSPVSEAVQIIYKWLLYNYFNDFYNYYRVPSH